jgi:hypothetical protein
VDAIRSKWRTAWETKARREVHARSGLWKNYLGEIRSSPAESARKYPYEVRNRAILSLLVDELPGQSDAAVVMALDQTLRPLWRAGGFVWDAALEVVFPKDSFWFLYGSLNMEKRHD